ncbi:MAG: methyltransferase domain-containing protein [Gammaproteobacteria bacterium]|jgi:ubiquinone/menaquinone biosynthesis C-methylase UbiE
MIGQLYEKHLLPRLVHLACGTGPITRQRATWIPRAAGRVLEIGFGSGLNTPFYNAARVQELVGLEPSDGMARLAGRMLPDSPFPVRLVTAGAEDIPLDTDSVDTVVTTYTLCTVPEPRAALAEMRRVLKPSGRLLFCEHGVAPDASVRRWQERLNPAWRALAGGCNLTRDVPALLAAAGFDVTELAADYLPGWRPASWNTAGCARVR